MNRHHLLAAAAMLLVCATASAEELKVPETPAADQAAQAAPASRPSRGMTMDRVEASFGAPTRRVSAVGEPPIARWEYPGFTVYFEHQHVIHTVASL